MDHHVVAIRATLEVRNVPEAIDFYRRALQLEPMTTMGDPPNFAILVGGQASLGIAEAASPAVAAIAACYVVVTDINEAFGHCQMAGAEVVAALTTHPWLMRDFVIRDPSGHLIAIGQRVAG